MTEPDRQRDDAGLLHDSAALVLAGGSGTRLRPLTERCAKPAVPFGGTLRIVDFALANCINSGLRDVGVLVQCEAASVQRHLQAAWAGTPMTLLPPPPGSAGYAGTADAVRQQLPRLRERGVRRVVVLAGDHVVRMDLARLLADHHARRADATVATIAVPLAQARGFGVLRTTADGRVTGFTEKPRHPEPMPGCSDLALASMGIYVFETELLAHALERDAADPASAHDFGHDLLPALVARARVCAHDFARSAIGTHDAAAPYWRDVGTLDAYWQAHQDLLGPQPGIDLSDPAWPLQPAQAGRPVRCVAWNGVGESLLGAECRIGNAEVRRSVLGPGVQVGDGSVVEQSVLLPGAVVGRGVVLRRAIVDAGCVLPDRLRVGENEAEDRARFEVSEGGVVVLTQTMLDAPRPLPRPAVVDAPRLQPAAASRSGGGSLARPLARP
jgi:glucose-1-phosphate adenylyltransferase